MNNKINEIIIIDITKINISKIFGKFKSYSKLSNSYNDLFGLLFFMSLVYHIMLLNYAFLGFGATAEGITPP